MRILAVDISNVFRRNWEASQGKEFSAAFDRTLQIVARFREGHDRVAICCDGGKSFRKAISPEYKANRSDPGEGYREQLRRTIERLQADGCTVLRSPEVDGGFAEADDVIGSLCKWAQEMGHSVSIVSADKDILQCVTSKDADPVVCRITPDKGEVHFAEQVKEALGVPPEQIANWLALCGDSSDGYKPYPKLGPTGAAALLNKFGSLPPIVLHATAEQMNEVLGNMPLCQRIKEIGPDPCFAALKLATLRCDLPLDFDALEREPVVASLTGKQTAPPPGKPVDVPQKPEPAPAAPSVVPARTAAADSPQSTALALRTLDPFALEPKSTKAAWWLAEVAFNSRCFGTKFPSIESMYVAMLEGRALGMSAIVSLKNAYVVKGNIGWSARCLRGQCLKHPSCEYFDVIWDAEEKTATAIFRRKGRPEQRHMVTLTDAREREFFGNPKWKTDPQSMLIACAEREAARLGWPDVVAGLWTPEELAQLAAGQIADAEFMSTEAA